MNFKKLFICSVSLAAMSAVAYLFACGWFINPDLGYTSYFRQDIPEKNNYFYSYLNYYDDSDNKTSDKEENIREWKKHLGGQVTEKSIEQLLYGISVAELKEIHRKALARQWTKIDGKWATNGMMRQMIQAKDMNTLNYLFYAKACEQYAWKRPEKWDDGTPDTKRAQDSLLEKGLELYKNSKPEFTRLRYAFQIVRMSYYSGRNEDCEDYYLAMIESAKKSKALAKNWAMAFYAGALDSKVEAAYYYSRVFSQCPRYSHEAMTSFRWLINDVDTAAVLKLCQDNCEKAVVHAMTGFTCFYPTLEPLKHVHSLCPYLPYIETLLIREINKVEDGLSATHFATNEALNSNEALQHARELKDLTIRYAGLRDVPNPALWYTAAAYLAHLTGDSERATLLADIAEKERPGPKVKEQLLAVRLLIETGLGPLNEAAEARMMPSIQWLFKKQQESIAQKKIHPFFDKTFAHYFAETLPQLYLKSGQPVKAALCLGIAEQYSEFARKNIHDLDAFVYLDRYTSIPQLQDMLRQLSDTEGKLTEYEVFLYSNNHFNNNQILEMIGTKYLRSLKFREAATFFERQSDGSKFFHLEYDPFADPPIKGGINRQKPDDTFSSSKLSFALEMANLQYRIQAAKKPEAEDMRRYANGLYQMSWFGNSWQLQSYHWTYGDLIAKPWIKMKQGDEMYHYYNLNPARDFYARAAERARDNELKACCLFMAAHCYQLNLPETSDLFAFKDGKRMYGSYFRNTYYDQLYKKYRRTDFYKNALTRCSYLSDFENMKGRR